MRMLKWIRNIFIAGVVMVCLLFVSGIVYEKSSEYVDGKKYAPPGRTISINGHRMHIFAKGKGKTTVVFASGFGIPCPYVEYYPLYNEISKHTRIAVYDRPGYGWSSISSTPRDINIITDEIHKLLVESGEKPPYILVGHSLASLEVLRFAQLYKNEVKGIVLLDGGNPEFYANENIADDAMNSLSLKSLLSKTGILRLLFNNSHKFLAAVYAPRNNLSLVPKDMKKTDEVMYLRNMVNKNKTDEDKNIKINASKVRASGKMAIFHL